MANVFTAQTRCTWTIDPGANAITNFAAANLVATAGVAVPSTTSGTVDRVAHLWVAKNATATFDLWGYSAGVGNWALFDQVTFARTVSEIQKIDGASAFDRVQAVCNALGTSGSVTARIGFGE